MGTITHVVCQLMPRTPESGQRYRPPISMAGQTSRSTSDGNKSLLCVARRKELKLVLTSLAKNKTVAYNVNSIKVGHGEVES